TGRVNKRISEIAIDCKSLYNLRLPIYKLRLTSHVSSGEYGSREKARGFPTYVKSLPSLEDRHSFLASGSGSLEQHSRNLRDPKKAAVLSLLPGLGQLYNGETGKGLLFLAVTAINLFLLLLLVFSRSILNALGQLAARVNLQFNWDLVKSPELSQTASAVSVVYLALILSFVAYAMREAYDHAVRSRQGTVFAKYFLGLSEATSGSYLFHFLVMATAISMVLFVAMPKPPVAHVTQIEFIPPPPPPPPEPEP